MTCSIVGYSASEYNDLFFDLYMHNMAYISVRGDPPERMLIDSDTCVLFEDEDPMIPSFLHMLSGASIEFTCGTTFIATEEIRIKNLIFYNGTINFISACETIYLTANDDLEIYYPPFECDVFKAG
ncbi:MAG: hypothetical protein SFT68_01515 [Rickettsiaceae bacterium]|nr:hypothetical protein [Rickettsiaceae bacterium]